MEKKPQLDEATRRIAERMLRMPKPHEEMKVGKSKAKAGRKKQRGPRPSQ
jgi:hypothetical protein